MRKSFIIGLLVVIALALGIACYLSQVSFVAKAPSKKELARDRTALAGQAGLPKVEVVVPIAPLKMSHAVRVAIGGLGADNDEQNRELGDLVAVDLSGAEGIELVERDALARILEEQNLTWSGLVRAKDAVRVGKLLKAEWFLLGSRTKITGAECLVVRVVDARTGILRDAGVFPVDASPQQLAAVLAGFVRDLREDANQARLHEYLAVGTFEDVGLNNRLANFPAQLHAYLTAAYRGANVTLLEREAVEMLLHEVELDLAGLTEDASTETPSPMQSAFWLLSGQYQSYETTNLQVEVNLEVHRIFGRTATKIIRAAPGEPVERLVKKTADEIMKHDDLALIPTRASEARLEMFNGLDLIGGLSGIGLSGNDLVVIGSQWEGNQPADSQTKAKRKRRLEDALLAFETVLLLDPDNHEAKMYLAAGMRNMLNLHPDVACRYYQEIINDPAQDKWTGLAQRALVENFLWFSPSEKLRWLKSAASQTTNDVAAAFYREQVKVAEDDVAENAGDSPKAEEIAEQRLFEWIRRADNLFAGKGGSSRGDFGMGDYLEAVGGGPNAAHKLAHLLPKMIELAPNLKAYLVTGVLSFQPDTNTPVLAEFQAVLTNSLQHPQQDPNPAQLWINIRQLYGWCLDKTNYPLAIQIMEAYRRAAEVKPGGASLATYEDGDRIRLAYAYMALDRWTNALAVFECISNPIVSADDDGPWGAYGDPLQIDKLANYCRQKLGQAPQPPNSRELDIGEPALILRQPAVFLTDQEGLWIGVDRGLLHLDFDLHTNLSLTLPVPKETRITALCARENIIWMATAGGGLFQFDKTSRQFRQFTVADGLLMDYLLSLDISGHSLWIGYGHERMGGLGVLDLNSLKPRSFTPSLEPWLLTNHAVAPPNQRIAEVVAGPDDNLYLRINEDLWKYEEASGRFETLMTRNSGFTIGPTGNYMTAGDQAQSLSMPYLGGVAAMAADRDWIAESGWANLEKIEISSKPDREAPASSVRTTNLLVSWVERHQMLAGFTNSSNYQWISRESPGEPHLRNVVFLKDLHTGEWKRLDDPDVFLGAPLALTFDGHDLWTGGKWTIAVTDTAQAGQPRKYCRVRDTIRQIQIAGGYVWALGDCALYRAPLSAWQ